MAATITVSHKGHEATITHYGGVTGFIVEFAGRKRQTYDFMAVDAMAYDMIETHGECLVCGSTIKACENDCTI